MEILSVEEKGKTAWNEFVKANYPPIGAFMQTWEWGQFQKMIGRTIDRYIVVEKGRTIAAFTLVCHRLPLGLSYGYLPRGPVIDVEKKRDASKIFRAIKDWAAEKFPRLIFLRLEPPMEAYAADVDFHLPSYYIQPRHNTAVELDAPMEAIRARLHPSTRSNLERAEKRGVTVEMKERVSDVDYEEFAKMMAETKARNGGKNIYPNSEYLHALFDSLPPVGDRGDTAMMSLGIFYGYHNGVPAAAHFVLYFGTTATYIYGASYTEHLASKVTTYLHWAGIQESKKRGMHYYDIGAIDKHRWPSLTTFKRQFGGREFDYIGNVNIPLRPFLYKVYDFLRKLRS